MSSAALRWVVIGLLLVVAIIHIIYPLVAIPLFDYPAEFSSAAPAFYLMGAIYLVGVAMLAANIRPLLFQKLVLIYTILLLLIWGAIGSRDIIAYSDTVIEVILVIALVALIRRNPAASATTSK